jgi:MoxR-like ATPase
LPEAQLDRFFFKLTVNYSTREELSVIIDRTTRGDWPTPQKIMDGDTIIKWQRLTRKIFVAPQVQDYAIRLILATHPQGPFACAVTNRFLRFGSSPRGAQTIVLASKIRAMLDGRFNVSFEDVRKVYIPALRHRILLNFEAQAENISPDTVLAEILGEVKEKASDAASLPDMEKVMRKG